eukprot:13250027-Alexandrium_andersonii.AAC.1
MAAESARATASQAEAWATEAVEQARRAAATAAADRTCTARPSARLCKRELEPGDGDGDGGPRGVYE